MTFVVDNLQQYFMADVLESQFSILIKNVDQSTNFEDLSIAHDNFIAAVLTHTFVNNKAVSGESYFGSILSIKLSPYSIDTVIA